MKYYFTQCGYTKSGLTSSVYTLATSEAEAREKAEQYFKEQLRPGAREVFGEVTNVTALPVTPFQQKWIDEQNRKAA